MAGRCRAQCVLRANGVGAEDEKFSGHVRGALPARDRDGPFAWVVGDLVVFGQAF